MSHVWLTPSGVLIADLARGRFHLVDDRRDRIIRTYDSGSVGLDDTLYTWRYEVVEDRLRKSMVSQKNDNPGHTSHEDVLALTPLGGVEALRWVEHFPTLLADLNAERADFAASNVDAKTRRRLDFLAAVANLPRVDFIRVGSGWGVRAPDRTLVWVDRDYPWRGKDLLAELARVLRDDGGSTQIELCMETEEDWAWYADD